MVSHPADADTLQEAVNLAIDLKKYERAEVWMAEAMRLQPQNPRLYMVQARLMRARGDNAGARRALETAQQLNRGARQSDGASVPSATGEATSQHASAPAGDAAESMALRPDGRNADADVMAQFEKRMAGGPSRTADAPVRSEVVSLDRPAPLSVPPAVLMAQAPSPRRQAPVDTSPSAPPVQVAQSELVPLRRPGGDSGSGGGYAIVPPPVPSAPGGPSASPGDADPLGREITRELTSLKKDFRADGRGRPGLPRPLGRFSASAGSMR